MLAAPWGDAWVPILEYPRGQVDASRGHDSSPRGQEGRSDVLWMVGVSSNDVSCVICKGGTVEPSVSARPMMTSLKMKIPTASADTSLAESEEAYVRAVMMYDVGGEGEEREATAIDAMLLGLINVRGI